MKGLKQIIVAGMLLFLTGCSEPKKVDTREEFLMNTIFKIQIYNNNDKEVMDKVYKRLFEIERAMSKTIATSEISKINENAGQDYVDISEDTYEVIERALKFANVTEGSFDPTIGPLVDLWKITESEENRTWLPTDEEIKKVIDLVDYKKVDLKDGEAYLSQAGMKLDLGGIAKGYGADEARRILKEEGVNSALIDLGGNIYAVGEKPDGSSWRIGIKNPDEEGNDYLGIVSVKDKSVVTSGGYERYFKLNGKVYHHIINPKTGYPANNGIRSVSIISDSSTDGDALATAVYIMGLERAKDLIKNFTDVGFIILTDDNHIYISKNLEGNFQTKNEKLKKEILE